MTFASWPPSSLRALLTAPAPGCPLNVTTPSLSTGKFVGALEVQETFLFVALSGSNRRLLNRLSLNHFGSMIFGVSNEMPLTGTGVTAFLKSS